jgi:hypothetical protein
MKLTVERSLWRRAARSMTRDPIVDVKLEPGLAGRIRRSVVDLNFERARGPRRNGRDEQKARPADGSQTETLIGLVDRDAAHSRWRCAVIPFQRRPCSSKVGDSASPHLRAANARDLTGILRPLHVFARVKVC